MCWHQFIGVLTMWPDPVSTTTKKTEKAFWQCKIRHRPHYKMRGRLQYILILLNQLYISPFYWHTPQLSLYQYIHTIARGTSLSHFVDEILKFSQISIKFQISISFGINFKFRLYLKYICFISEEFRIFMRFHGILK